MAVDNKNITLSVDQVQTVARVLEPDILESASLVNNSVFEQLKINVIRNLENVNSLMVFDRKVGTTRRYRAGRKVENKVGYIHERELKVELSMNRYTENAQNFREKEPFSIAGFNETGELNAPVSEFIMRQIAIAYSSDVMSNLFFGDYEKGDDDPYGLYNGFFAHINRDINRGLISVANHNYQVIDPIDGTDPKADYQTFVQFYENLDPKMLLADTVYIYMSTQTRQRILRGYMQTYSGFQVEGVANPEYRMTETPKAQLCAHPALGVGDCLIATTEYNFEFGTDLSGSTGDAKVMVNISPDDFNVYIFQIQTAQGTRIRQITSDHFCVSSGKNTPIKSTGGEYTVDTVTTSVNDESMGSVAVTPDQPSYEAGDKITMTATAKPSHEFVKWDDGATTNPRTIVFSGNPEHYQAIFKATV